MGYLMKTGMLSVSLVLVCQFGSVVSCDPAIVNYDYDAQLDKKLQQELAQEKAAEKAKTTTIILPTIKRAEPDAPKNAQEKSQSKKELPKAAQTDTVKNVVKIPAQPKVPGQETESLLTRTIQYLFATHGAQPKSFVDYCETFVIL